jgi:RHS repeat-associated protein
VSELGPGELTGKERDAETGLDYFGARYMSAAQGRFTSTDPIFIAKHKISDPQQWNLYSYVANNPLKFVDPSGMAVKLVCEGKEGQQTCNEVVTDLNSRKDAAFQTKLDANGKLQVIDADKVDPTKLSPSEAALFNSILDADHTARLTVVSQSDSVQFGLFS